MATEEEALRYLHAALPGVALSSNMVQLNLDIPSAEQLATIEYIRDYLTQSGLAGLTLPELMSKPGGQKKGEFFIADPSSASATQRQIGLHKDDLTGIMQDLIQRFGSPPSLQSSIIQPPRPRQIP